MNASAYSSGFFSPLAVMAAAVIFSGSRVPMWQDSQRSTMLASATLIWTIVGSQSRCLSSSSPQSARREIDHVIGDVVVHLGLGFRDWLQHVAAVRGSAWCARRGFRCTSLPVAEM